ncbi:MAG: YitT family protein [Anaeroplasma sp.]
MESEVKESNKFTREQIFSEAFRIIIVFASSIIYALSVAIFLEPAGLLSIGLTAVGQIFSKIMNLIIPNCPNILKSVGLYSLIFNIPLCLYGLKSVSPKFIFYTLLSVIIQSIFLAGWIDGEYILKNIIGIIPESERLFLAIIAGLLCGVGIGLALRYGTSTGGVDILAQAFSLKKGISIGIFSTLVNICLAIINGIIAGELAIALYTFIFIIITNIVVDKIHTAYNYLRIDVVTKNKEEVSQALITGIKRGCTILDVQGAYTNEMKYDVFMVVSSYELEKAKRIIYGVDPNAFIMVLPVKRIIGAFFKHTII